MEEEKYIEKLNKLQECQESKNKNSCIGCEKFFTCKTRKEYVESVYKSMNPDLSQGGFNF